MSGEAAVAARGGLLKPEYVVAVVYVAGLFMSIMDTSIVNTALPSVAREFRTTASTTQWVVIGYLLSLAVWIPASGWIGDRVGTKKTFLFALGLFTAASALCGTAGSLNQLVLFRVLQGVGGGMLAPVGQAMLYRAFPPERRIKAATVLVLGTALAPASGPVLGGLLVTKLSWRWCFYVNVPIGLAAFVFGLVFVVEHRESKPGRFDAAWFVLSTVGLPLLLYAVSEGPNRGWTSPVVLGTGAAGILGLVVLVVVELRQRVPMLNFRLFGNRIFRATNLVLLFSTSAFLGNLFIMPQFLQLARGASALSSGLTTFPGAIGVIIMSQVTGRIYGRIGPRRLVMAGLVCMSVGLFSLSFVGLTTNLWRIRLTLFAMGCSNSWVFMPLQASAFSTISSEDTGRASALFNTGRQVGSAVGVAILSTVVAASLHLRAGGPLPAAALQVVAYRRAFLAAAVVAFLGILVAATIHDSDAAATMRRRSRGSGGEAAGGD